MPILILYKKLPHISKLMGPNESHVFYFLGSVLSIGKPAVECGRVILAHTKSKKNGRFAIIWYFKKKSAARGFSFFPGLVVWPKSF